MSMTKDLLRLAGAAVLTLAMTGGAMAAGDVGGPCAPKDVKHTERHWSFQGVFGHYDHDAALRGFEVYKGVCAACHSLELFKFRNLADLGATEAEIKGVALEYEVAGPPDDFGDPTTRPALPSDGMPPAFANDKAAAASNGGAIPPDLSLMLKAREGLDDHVANILTGYQEAPAGCEVPEGQYYNAHFPGYKIGMAPPLFEDAVTYNDGTPASMEQMTQDLTQFLMFVAEPKLEERKQMGMKVIVFLVILTVLLYLVKREVWRDVH